MNSRLTPSAARPLHLHERNHPNGSTAKSYKDPDVPYWWNSLPVPPMWSPLDWTRLNDLAEAYQQDALCDCTDGLPVWPVYA